MYNNDNNAWLNKAILYLTEELENDEKIAFRDFIEQNNEFAEKFRILKKIWHTDLKDVPNHTPDWERLSRAINQEFALTYYLRKVNLERFDDKSASLLRNIESELPKEDLCCVENVVNSLFTDDKPAMFTPTSDLWEKVEASISNELKSKNHTNRSTSSQSKLNSVVLRNRSVLITAISSAAAIITLFLILFVFMPSTSTKIAETTDIEPKDENVIEKTTVDNQPRISPEDSKKTTTVENTDKNPKAVETIKNDENSKDNENPIPDVVRPKDPPSDENSKKNGTEKDIKENKTDNDVVKEDTDDTVPDKEPTEKNDTEEGSGKTMTQDVVLNTKYDPIDPEKLKFNLPDSFGRQLSFTYYEEENAYNVIDVPLPTKQGGYKLTTDKNNNLIADWNNDGKPDKVLTSSTYKDFRLQYDNGKITKVQYRVKFVRIDDTWRILPACGLRSKKSYGSYEIMLIDANVNGIYSDINSDFYQYDNQEIQILNTVNYINDNWVKIVPDNSGMNIRIQEYLDKNIGTLRINANYSENVTLKWISLKGDVASITATSENINELMVPAGEYRIIKGVVGDGKTEIEFVGDSNIHFPVIAGTTSDLDLGGELKLSAYSHIIQDGRVVINRNNLYLIGQNRERYYVLRSKYNSEIMTIKSSYVTHSENKEYYKNLNIQGTTNSEIITITLPAKMSEPGTYIIKFIEDRFSKFLVGEPVTSQPILVKRN